MRAGSGGGAPEAGDFFRIDFGGRLEAEADDVLLRDNEEGTKGSMGRSSSSESRSMGLDENETRRS